MRVLLTGHHGYIGSVTAPLLLAAGHEVAGLDTFFYEGCDLAPTRPGGSRAAARRPRRRARAPRGLRRRRPPRRRSRTTRSATSAPSLTREINFEATVAPRPRGEGGGRRPLRLRLLLQHVRRRRATRRRRRRDGPAPAADAPTRSRRCAPRRRLPSSPTTTSRPIFMRNATAYGVSPRLRLDLVLNNLVGWALHDRQGEDPERRHARGGRSSTSRTSRARRSPLLDGAARARPRPGLQRRARTARTTRCATWPRSSRETVPRLRRSSTRARGDPDPRSYRVDFGKLARDVSGAPARRGRRGAGAARAASTPTARPA